MSGRFDNRPDFSIPSALLDEHEWMSDALIDDLGIDCILVYPPSDEECPNCEYDPVMGRSANIYKTGGPIEFETHTTCPWCGGVGKRSVPVEGAARLRVYWGGMEVNAAIRQFSKEVQTRFADNPTGILFVIGYMYDMPNFIKTDSIVIPKNNLRTTRVSEPIPWGFRKDRYFASVLERQ